MQKHIFLFYATPIECEGGIVRAKGSEKVRKFEKVMSEISFLLSFCLELSEKWSELTKLLKQN